MTGLEIVCGTPMISNLFTTDSIDSFFPIGDNSLRLQVWAVSSAGRAPRSQCGGRGFDPLTVHQPSPGSIPATLGNNYRIQFDFML
jgi:hypothetical protein